MKCCAVQLLSSIKFKPEAGEFRTVSLVFDRSIISSARSQYHGHPNPSAWASSLRSHSCVTDDTKQPNNNTHRPVVSVRARSFSSCLLVTGFPAVSVNLVPSGKFCLIMLCLFLSLFILLFYFYYTFLSNSAANGQRVRMSRDCDCEWFPLDCKTVQPA